MATRKRNPEHFFNRELSWVRFNERVLEEAEDASHPLLERLKFLSIFSSNLDEFFMIRVAGLKEQINASIVERTPDGRTAREATREIAQLLKPLIARQSRTLMRDVMPKLRKAKVRQLAFSQLKAARKQEVRQYFKEKIFPILTPLAIDPAHPFPHLRGLGLNLLVELKTRENDPQLKVAVVPLPPLLNRFYGFKGENGAYDFILLEHVVEQFLEELFPRLEILSVYTFRITRNADLDISEAEADDLLMLIERELRKRRLGTIVRLEVHKDMPELHVEFLKSSFGLDEQDTYRINSHLGVDSFIQLLGAVDNKALKDEPFTPALHPRVASSSSIFSAIRKGDILLHHPYDSFYPVVELVEEAAKDPKVLAIKMTLYRAGGRSSIVNALKEAVMNGKEVTALIELKARFDEATNITWAKELERAGVNVVYGILGLKTHGKLLMVLRQESDAIRHYVHMSTGNYNEKTARLYTDIGMLTCKPELGADISELFNLLTGYSRQEKWRQVFVSPIDLRQQFIGMIKQCIAAHSDSRPSTIRITMNSLVDPEMIQWLYEASNAGVKVQLLIRGICCLRPGVPGLSANIHVRSIVGRFLEHTRIYTFEFGDEVHMYSGSADWMQRNLNRRIEVAFPITDPTLKEELQALLDLMFQDNIKARVLQPDGTYVRVKRAPGEPALSLQDYLLNEANQKQGLVNTIHQKQEPIDSPA